MPERTVLTFPASAEPPPVDDEPGLVRAAARELRVAPEAVRAARTTRVSFDARRRERRWRVALDVYLDGEEPPERVATTPPAVAPPPAGAPRAVVIGSGPAGLWCALDLLAGGVAVELLERGRDVRARRRPIARLNRGEPADPDCNYCFGEGGAGTYSDGKLYARSGRRAEVRAVLETLVAHGAPPSILYSWRPHVGSNRLPAVVQALRESIRRGGGTVRFGCRAEELETAEGSAGGRRVTGVVARELDTGERVRLAADAVVLATGHSALDSVRMAARAGARLEPKGFAMGVRAEHGQAWLDARQYGGMRERCELPASFYELATQVDERGVYSFCMCPGGFIVPSTTAPDRVVVNGMSLSRRDSPFANSGLVVAVEPEDWCGARGRTWGWPELLARARAGGPGGGPLDARGPVLPATDELPAAPGDDPLFGIRLQHALELLAARAGGGRNRAPCARTDRFAEGAGAPAEPLATSYRPGLAAVDLAELLPRGLLERLRAGLADFDRRLPGFVSERGQLVGVETRTSSPVRIARDRETLESPELAGLYPAGEGAGYAGGIVSAAIDGRRVAARVLEGVAR